MATEVKAVIEITKESIEVINKALDLYNKVLDQIVPWKEYEQIIKDLERYREDYSNESAVLVGEVKTLIRNAEDAYFSATQTIYEWCSLAERLLVIYLDLFSKKTSTTYESQKALLLKVLDEGVKKMTTGQAKLEQCSINFNGVAGKLTTLQSRLINDFDEKSTYFEGKLAKLRAEAYGGAAVGILFGPFGVLISYSVAAGKVEGQIIPDLKKQFGETKKFFDKLQVTIDSTNVQIDSTKLKLRDEIKGIGVLKVQTDETKALIPMDYLDALRDTIVTSVNNLIAECKVYQKRHGKKN